ncbi:Hypothetical_protein [Hexamita inflata]|uniref:Hypothetical_protein n=1 Tax=Hexamita inflata TaxID=28002 RepID=A0AA86N8X2_9EUKA|nr:Hypothetical protein HINF_LOCUS2528 [Hexamita inflata]
MQVQKEQQGCCGYSKTLRDVLYKSIKLMNEMLFILHYLECRPPADFQKILYFQKISRGLQVRANLADYGSFFISDLVFHFGYRTLFLKYSSNINQFLIFAI